MLCKYCGKEIADGMMFCPACGGNLAAPVSNDQPKFTGQAQNIAQPAANEQVQQPDNAQPQYGTQPPYNNGQAPYGTQPPYNNGQAPYGTQPPYNNGQAPYGTQPPYNNGQAPYGTQPPYNNGQAPYGANNNTQGQGFFSDFSIASVPSAPGPNNGSVDFLTAIKLFFKNYFNFKGRASKSEYWWAFLFNILVGFIPFVGQILSLACIIPGIAIALRRLHDVGKSGAYYFICLVPFFGFIILLVALLKDSDGDNQYGPATPAQNGQAQYGQPQQPYQY